MTLGSLRRAASLCMPADKRLRLRPRRPSRLWMEAAAVHTMAMCHDTDRLSLVLCTLL